MEVGGAPSRLRRAAAPPSCPGCSGYLCDQGGLRERGLHARRASRCDMRCAGSTADEEKAKQAEEAQAAEEAAARKVRARSRSFIASPTEKAARELRALAEAKSQQEQADEAQVPKTLARGAAPVPENFGIEGG